MKNKSGYKAFSALLGDVLKTPHSEIKAKLEEEKRAKKKPSKKRASVRASDDKG